MFSQLKKVCEEGNHLTDYSTNHGKILAFHIIINPDPSCFVFGNAKLGSRNGPVHQRCESLNTSHTDILRRDTQNRVGREGVIMNDCRHIMRENERQ